MAQLAERNIQHVYVDGGQTVQAFLRAGLIDRITITRVPVIIGSGVTIFGALRHDMHVQHIRTRHFPSGLVQSEYAVLRSSWALKLAARLAGDLDAEFEA